MSDKPGPKPTDEDESLHVLARKAMGLEPGMAVTVTIGETKVSVAPNTAMRYAQLYNILLAAIAAIEVYANMEYNSTPEQSNSIH